MRVRHAPWHAALLALALERCALLSAEAVAHAPKLLKVQLHKHKQKQQQQQQRSSDRSYRLIHQQTRAQRRALEETGGVDGDFGVGALAMSSSSLGVGYGTHYAELYLGIPTQRASVIVDTGSHVTALPCSTCDGCGQHTDPLFNVSRSTTAKYMACHEVDSCLSCDQDRCYISQSYFEGSMWRAVVVEELVWVGGLSSPVSDEMEGFLRTFGFRFPLGCQTTETGLFLTQKENGIMGLGRHKQTVMSYMLKTGRVLHNVFTLCFASDGGELVFGGVDYSHHTSTVDYTPLRDNTSTYYPVHVKNILLNGVSLGIGVDTINSGRGVLVDSGTTDTFFDGRGNRKFMKAFRHAAGGREYSDEHMRLSHEDLAALPIISIVLSGMKGDGTDDIQLDVPASKYLSLSDDNESYVGNFHFSERSGGVLGSSAMVGFDVIFDGENNRIGFAESSCGKSYTNEPTVSPTASNTTGQPLPTTTTPIAPDQQAPANASINSTSNGSAADANATATALADTGGSAGVIAGDVNTSATALADTVGSANRTSSPFANETSRQAGPDIGVIIAGVILIALVGVGLGVMVWTKWRMRSWSRIPKRAHFDIADLDSIPLSRVPGRPLSPRSQSDSIAWLPKFTIGSIEEEDSDELRGEEDDEGVDM